MNTHRLGARPQLIALTKNSTAAIFITAIRPILSEMAPPRKAPAAAPSSADATAKPNSAGGVLNSCSMAETAPLMTALS